MSDLKQKASVAVVVQRYGNEIGGGAEYCCQLIAERLQKYYEIEVLTTCAKDYRTWKNEYQAGQTEVNGIPVRRFPAAGERDTRQFERVWEKLFWREHTPEEEMDFFRYQGPYTPELVDYVRNNRNRYDAFMFVTYLYYPTALALPLVGPRAIFLPTAHDEAPLYLNHFDQIFRATPHLVFLTEEERQLVHRRFTLDSGTGSVVGMGIDNPWSVSDEPGWRALRERLGNSKIVTFVGRIDAGKGCDTLVEYFLRYPRSRHPEGVKLLLLGRQAMAIPDHPDIVAPGFVSDYVKAKALEASAVSVAPASMESFCIAALEAWYYGCPVLANGRSEVLVGHCLRSNGGLWYENYEEFEVILGRILSDNCLAESLRLGGQEYVRAHYRWSRIEEAYRRILDGVIADGRKGSHQQSA